MAKTWEEEAQSRRVHLKEHQEEIWREMDHWTREIREQPEKGKHDSR